MAPKSVPKKRSTSRSTSQSRAGAASQAKAAAAKPAPAAPEPPKETPEEAKLREQHEKYDSVFAKYDEGGKGALKKGELLKIVRDCNEEFTFLDDRTMPAFMRQQWTDAKPDEEGLVHFHNFASWYESFMAYFKEVQEKFEAERASKAKEAASRFEGDGTWTIMMTELTDALAAAWAKHKAPLLIDMTSDGDGTTALETYYAYSGHMLVEMKKMVVEVNMKKTVSLEDALQEQRKKVILGLKRGYNVVLLLSNSAPPFKSRFSSPTTLPYILVDDYEAVQSVVGTEANWKQVQWTKELVTQEDDVLFVHDDFNVVVVTKFSPDTYAEYLKDEFPLDKMQHIIVKSHS